MTRINVWLVFFFTAATTGFITLFLVSPAAAQTAPAAVQTASVLETASADADQAIPSVQQATSKAVDDAPGLFPHANYHFQWDGLGSSDPRFSWEGIMGVDVTFVQYRGVRLNMAADYDAVLGGAQRALALSHNNYMLSGYGSYRTHAYDVSVGFFHESRHLADGDNPNVISWNVLGVHAAHRYRVAGNTIDATLGLGRVLQRTFVDYAWKSDLHLTMRRIVTDRVGLFVNANEDIIGVDHDKLGRGRQAGGLLEGGVRVLGQAAALELFAGYERRIDAFPTDRVPLSMLTCGFRIVSR